ncbi:integrase catalytic domain-containing protein [Trichonephila clavipes]|nr:integrase catalytic domain-containing protein [Trichonephila clavipes]
MQNENSTDIRNMIDCVQKYLRALKVLKYEQNKLSDILLINILVEKLDRESRRNFESSHKSKTVPTFQEFIEFLEQRESVLLSVSVDRNAKVNPNKIRFGDARDDPILHERDQAIEIFKETVEFEKGRYIVRLPFRKSYNELSDNYPLSKQRFQNLWRRFGQDSELYQQYRKIIRDYTEQGIIEEVKTEITDNELKRPVYYLPHQAFKSIFLLAATIRHHIEKYKHEFPDTVELLDRSFSVGDLISGGNEFEEALQTSRRAKYIMEAAGMDIRKWINNDANLMEQWKKENFNVHPVRETPCSTIKLCNPAHRLELLGALVAARLASKVKKIVNLKRSCLQYHWTDSKIVLFCLKGNKTPDGNNSLLTESTKYNQPNRSPLLVPLCWWWTGAEFLSDSEFPKNFQQVVPELDYLTEHEKETVVQERKKLPEADRSEETVLLNSDSSSILDELLELSNNYFKVINILSYIFRFNYNCRNKSEKVEGILNSRLLTPLISDADNFDVLTPGHFLIGRPITSIPGPNLIDANENRLIRWEKITKVVQRTWKKWKSEYLNTLQARSKWITEKNDLMIGQMVLIKEDFLPINTWLFFLGRILEVYHGSDGKGRVVVYRASTPQVWGSINGLGKVDSAFHHCYIGSINEYQACLES